MELLCPSCQQKLSIPDQYAGQLAKCPFCNSTFPAPALAPTPAAAPPPPPPVPPQAPPATQPAVGPPEPGTYHVQPPPATPPAWTPPPESAAPRVEPVPVSVAPTALPPPPPAPVPTDYTKRWSIWLSPHVLPWIAVAAVVVVFALSFFVWVGIYVGGVPAQTQSGWQAAFGTHTLDEDVDKLFKKMVPVGTEQDKKDPSPSASFLLILYVLLLLIPLLLLTVGAAVLNVLNQGLPPWVQRLRPWRWGLVALIGLLALLVLLLQATTGFPVENKLRAEVDKGLEQEQKAAQSPAAQKQLAAGRGMILSCLHRGRAFGLSCWLLVLAVVCAALTFWIERRAPRPIPRIDIQW
jgi:hypothetical protein